MNKGRMSLGDMFGGYPRGVYAHEYPIRKTSARYGSHPFRAMPPWHVLAYKRTDTSNRKLQDLKAWPCRIGYLLNERHESS